MQNAAAATARPQPVHQTVAGCPRWTLKVKVKALSPGNTSCPADNIRVNVKCTGGGCATEEKVTKIKPSDKLSPVLKFAGRRVCNFEITAQSDHEPWRMVTAQIKQMPRDDGAVVIVEVKLLEPRIQIAPVERVFRDMVFRTAALEETFTITNVGDGPLDITSVELVENDANHFAIVSPGSWAKKLDKNGDSTTVKVRFDPKAAGSHAAKLKVVSANAVNPPQAPLPVRGKATKPKIELTPTVDFGKFHAGGIAKTMPVTIKNVGDAPLDITAIRFSANPDTVFAYPPNSWTARLENTGDSTQVQVTFTPKNAAKLEIKLQVDSNDPDKPTEEADLKAAVFGLKELKIPAYLASGKESVNVTYEVLDPADIVDGGSWQILDDQGTSVWSKTDYAKGDAEIKNGAVTKAWDGKIAGASTGVYPDEYVTVEHSPYKLKVTATATGADGPATLETTFKVEIDSIEIELGERTAITTARHLELFDRIGSLPRPGGSKKELCLTSNIFKIALPERLAVNGTSYTEYETLWGAGPMIPLYAKLMVRTSSGGKDNAPKALGKVPVLWDYDQEAQDTSGLHAHAQAFVNQAIDSEKTTTQPTGDNCFGSTTATLHRGGKRAAAGDTFPVFPASAGYGGAVESTFNFAVTTATTRKWAAYSEPWRTGTRAGKSGVIFQPSRIAGDTYKITAYVDVGKKLDKLGKIEGDKKDSTGVWEVWREIHVIASFRKNNAVTPYTHSDIERFYKQAFVKMVDKAGGARLMPNYDTLFAAAIRKQPAGPLRDLAILNPNAQLAGSDSAVTFKAYAAFKAAYIADYITKHPLVPVVAAHAAGKNQFEAAAFGDANDVVGARKFANECDDFASDVALDACNYLLPSIEGDGVVVFHFAYGQSNWSDATGITNGVALNRNNISRTKTGYLQLKTAATYAPPQSMSQTVAHEIGHCVFLPHTKRHPGMDPLTLQDPDAHDDLDDHCLMGYLFTVARNFCGYCNLRLRGWDHRRLTKVRADNARIPVIDAAISSAAFGDTDKGTESAEQTVTIKNTGKGPLTIQTVTLTGAGAADFLISADLATGQSLPTYAGATDAKTVKIKFKPKSGGAKSANVSIAHNATGSPKVIAITGTGKEPLITVSQPTSFTTTASQAVRIKNTGNGGPLDVQNITVEGAHLADFTVNESGLNKNLAAAAESTFQITFVAGGTGERTATLRVVSNAPTSPTLVALTATGSLPAIGVTGTRDFAIVQVGVESAANVLTVTNTGSVGLQIESVTLTGPDAGDFSIQDTSLNRSIAGSANSTFSAKFKPRTAGAKTAKLSIASNAAGSPLLLDVTGTGEAPSIHADKDKIEFDDVAAGTESTAQTITVSNPGHVPLKLQTLTLTGNDAGDFVIKDDSVSGKTLAAAASETVKIAANTRGKKLSSANLSIPSDAPGSPKLIPLTVKRPQIEVLPASLQLHVDTLNTASAPKGVVVKNTGAANLRIADVVMEGTDAASFTIQNQAGWTNKDLAAGASEELKVTFTITAAGSKAANIRINSNDAGTPFRVSVTGATPPRLSASAVPQFANTASGANSADRAITFTNVGKAALNIQSVTLVGSDSGNFQIRTDNATGRNLTDTAPGNTADASVRFSPTSAGAKFAYLRVASTDPDSPLMIALIGTGT